MIISVKKKLISVTIFSIIAFIATFVYAKNEVSSSKLNYKNFGIIVSGPSGVGKTTIVENVAKQHPELSISVSATTRKRRKGEVDGKSYYFIDTAQFQKLAQNNEFIEYAENYGNYYGSPKRNYHEAIKNNQDAVFVLSVEGAQNATKNTNMDFVTIFIAAPSDDVLLKRLTNRKTETQEQIKKRFEKVKREMTYAEKYDYVIYNYDLEKTTKNFEAIYSAEKLKRLK